MTSIEWLINQLHKKQYGNYPDLSYNQMFDKAKDMHKKEIIDAYNEGFKISGEGWNGEYGIQDFKNLSKEIKSEDYYNQIIE
jgi:hypothetical protein